MQDNEQDKTGRPEPTPEKDERIFVGADPSDLEHSRNRVAYLTGYKHGIWDIIHIALSFAILIAIIRVLTKAYVSE